MQPPNEGHERPPQPPYYPPGQQYGPPQYPQQPPYYPPPPGQPPRKKRRRWPIFLLVGALLLCVIIGVAVATSAPSAKSPTTSATSTTAGSTATTAPTSKASTPASQPKWTTTHTFTGNGNKKTAIFSVPDDWKIVWSCVGQNIGGVTADGVLAVSVYGGDNSLVDVGTINATCKVGQAKTTGETEEHQGGSVYLSVDATGDWTIQVQELK